MTYITPLHFSSKYGLQLIDTLTLLVKLDELALLFEEDLVQGSLNLPVLPFLCQTFCPQLYPGQYRTLKQRGIIKISQMGSDKQMGITAAWLAYGMESYQLAWVAQQGQVPLLLRYPERADQYHQQESHHLLLVWGLEVSVTATWRYNLLK